jgi:hypothetical protein
MMAALSNWMQIMRKPLHPALRPWLLGGLLACSALAAQARGHWSVNLNLGFPVGPAYGGYYGGPVYAAPGYGSYVTALPQGAVSVTVGGGHYWRHGGLWYRPWGPRWVVVAPPVYVATVPQVVEVAPPPPPIVVAPSKPEPIIYPRKGQDAQQTEADRQECNRWATTQPAAMADASVFQRAVQACMDGRGYTMR